VTWSASDLIGSRRGDLPVVAVAGAAWCGASLARPMPWWMVTAALASAVGAALVPGRRRLVVVAVAVLVAASGLGGRALAGLHPRSVGPFDGAATLVADPERTAFGGVRVDVRVDGRRLLAEARAPAAVEAVAARATGERLLVRGEVEAFDQPMAWAQARHLAGRLRIDAVAGHGAAAPHAAAADGVRRVLERGTAGLPEVHAALLAGLTLGDDRRQPPELAADFRAAGLSHLLVVSGSNVVLLLVLARPLLRRLRTWPRLLAAVGLVVGFAAVTRFEPSVLRAAAMAVVALGAATAGRASGGLRHLAIAVTVLLLVDPLLTRSVGFRLSVAACAGVLLLAPALVSRLPGPRWVREPLGLTIAAQVGVAPILVPTFGAMPLAALPANVVAAPLAAGLVAWGMTAGLVAGVVGGTAAAVLHLPTRVGAAALERVAAWAAALPLGHVDLRHLAVLAGAAWLLARAGPVRLVGAVLVAGVLVVPGTVAVPAGAAPAGWAATVWSDGPVALVEVADGASAVDVLDVLRRRRVRRVALVVVRSPREQPGEVVRAVRARFPVDGVLAPAASPIPGRVVPAPGADLRVGGFRVHVDRAEPTVVARVGWAGGGAAAGPAVGSPGAPGAGPPPVRPAGPHRAHRLRHLGRGPPHRRRRPVVHHADRR